MQFGFLRRSQARLPEEHEGGTVISGCLKAKPGPWLKSWFRADRSWWQQVVLRKTDTLEREAVRLCLAYLPEVEAWWDTQAPSQHITSWPVRCVLPVGVHEMT